MASIEKELVRDQSEIQFENELIQFLSENNVDTPEELKALQTQKTPIQRTQNWKYRKDIKTTEALWDNFKKILEQHNMEVLDRPLSYSEFAQVKKQIEDLDTPYKAGRFLYGLNGVSQVEVDLDDGRHVFLTVFKQDNVGAGDTVYEVVNQIHRPKAINTKKDRRFDVTLLINGLPIIQIELKKAGVSVDEALEQMRNYIREDQYKGIYSTLQILVAMNPHDAVYMANSTLEGFNKEHAFHWQEPESLKKVRKWKDFSKQFLSIPMAHNMSSRYMILDGDEDTQSLMVMRPYQVYATQNVWEKARNTYFSNKLNRLGYIWHTTGSGKTVTSFKTAWLCSMLPNVDKVVFLVDRKSLTRQTSLKYKAYNPEGTSDEMFSRIQDTSNTNVLSRALKKKDNSIIVTSVQKLQRLVSRKNFKSPDQRILFIVDEAHRSTGGEVFAEIQKKFTNSAWVGYTGTPVFDDKSSNKVKTVDIFGPCLHSYTIRDAIADNNVLGFKVDFQTTIDQEAMKTYYLPKFYKEKYPNWSDQKIAEKIESLTQEDMDDTIAPSFYDNNDDHIKLVVKDIVDYWPNRSRGGKFSALLTTHVHGGSSIPMAMKYYREFKRVNKELEAEGKEPLKVAVTFSQDTSNSEYMTETNQSLAEAIADFNEVFGTSCSEADVEDYFNKVMDYLKRENKDGKYLDLVIVVDQLLTGFDARNLNTLYVDRTLKGANLIQAYSRTNRKVNKDDKPTGRIVNYRWPANNEKLMKDALAIYSNKDYENLSPMEREKKIIDEKILSEPFKDALKKVQDTADWLRQKTDDFNDLPRSEEAKDEMVKKVLELKNGVSLLQQYDFKVLEDGTVEGYDSNNPDGLIEQIGMTKDEFVALSTTLVNDLKKWRAKKDNVPVAQIDLKMTYLKDIKVNYDYLTNLLEDLLNQVHDDKKAEAQATSAEINKFADGLEDRDYARDIYRTTEAIMNREFPPAGSDLKYPYKLYNSEDVVKESNAISLQKLLQDAEYTSMQKVYLAFRIKWSMTDIATNAQIRAIIADHEYGKRDLEESYELEEIITIGSRNYKELTNDNDVRGMSKFKYANNVRDAFYQLADAEKAEM